MKPPRYTIRELTLLVIIVALALAWAIDRCRYEAAAQREMTLRMFAEATAQRAAQTEVIARTSAAEAARLRVDLADCQDRTEALERELEERREPDQGRGANP